MSKLRAPLLRVLRPLLGAVQLNQLVRLLPVAEVVRAGAPASVLDVGSGSRGLARWLPSSVSVVALDHSFDDYGASRRPSGRALPVLGDVVRLPFRNDSFDTVVAVDLLEHLPPPLRPAAVRELVRVARQAVVLAGPADAPALAADQRLHDLLTARPGGAPPWLVEHLEHGMPSTEELRALLAAYGEVTVRGNLNTEAHVRLVLRELRPAAFLPTRLEAGALGAAYRWVPGARPAVARRLSSLGGQDAAQTYRSVLTLDLRTANRQ